MCQSPSTYSLSCLIIRLTVPWQPYSLVTHVRAQESSSLIMAQKRREFVSYSRLLRLANSLAVFYCSSSAHIQQKQTPTASPGRPPQQQQHCESFREAKRQLQPGKKTIPGPHRRCHWPLHTTVVSGRENCAVA